MAIYAQLYPYSNERTSSTVTGNVFACSSVESGVRANYGSNFGLWLFEVAITDITDSSSACEIGLCTIRRSLDPDEVDSFAGNHSEIIAYRQDGGIANFGANTPSWGDTYTNGDVISVAYSNGSVWFAKNGVWQNSGNPVSGGGEAVTGLTDILFPYAFLGDDSVIGNYSITFRFDPSEFTYSLPTGFSGFPGTNTIFSGYAQIKTGASSQTGYQYGTYLSTTTSYIRIGVYSSVDYNGFWLFDYPFINPDARCLKANIILRPYSTDSYAACNGLIACESNNASAFPSSANEYDSKTLASNTVEWDIPRFTTSGDDDYKTSPDIYTIINELSGISGWTKDSPLFLTIKEDGVPTTTSRRQVVPCGSTDIGLDRCTHVWFDWRVGGALTFEPVQTDTVGISDVVDATSPQYGVVSDDFGVDDALGTDPPYGIAADSAGIGDWADAERMIASIFDDVSIDDSIDAFSLSVSLSDGVSIADTINAISLSGSLSDTAGIEDLINVLGSIVHFSTNAVEHLHEIVEDTINVIQAPLITASFSMAGPAVVGLMGGMRAEFRVPGPAIVGEINLHPTIEAAIGVPGPAIAGALYQELDLTGDFSMAGPAITARLNRPISLSSSFSIPGPAVIAAISHGTDIQASFGMAGPKVTVSMRHETSATASRFGVLKHTRW